MLKGPVSYNDEKKCTYARSRRATGGGKASGRTHELFVKALVIDTPLQLQEVSLGMCWELHASQKYSSLTTACSGERRS